MNRINSGLFDVIGLARNHSTLHQQSHMNRITSDLFDVIGLARNKIGFAVLSSLTTTFSCFLFGFNESDEDNKA